MLRVLTLEGITLKGKNRVREHGKFWRVLKISDDMMPGMVCIEPVPRATDMRWINPLSDKHFKVVDDEEMTDLQLLNKLGLDSFSENV